MEVCRFYAKGHCAFGTACRYEHVRPGEGRPRGGAPQAPAKQEEQQLELEEERVDPYDDQPCTFRQLREKYFGLYSEVDMRKYWQSEMQPTGNARPALRAVSAAESRGSRNVCKFFLKGSCSFGDSCRNLHVVDVAQLDGDPAVSSQAAPGRSSAAPPELDGRQDPLDPSGGRPFSPQPAASGSQSPQELQRSREDRWSRRARAGDDAECGICFESIRGKGEKFGMLESCACAFCLGCIRSWRKQKEQQDKVNLRMCPLCRNESFFVVPCDSLIMDPSEKSMAIDKYKHQMSLVPCQAFDYGRGKCPFGSSCFYAHLNPDGTRYNPAPVRKMVGMSGTQVIGEVKLSDFF